MDATISNHSEERAMVMDTDTEQGQQQRASEPNQSEGGEQKTGQPVEEGDPDNQDLATSSFMSFEEWKEMMLRKTTQDPGSIRDKRQREPRGDRDRDSGVAYGDLDGVGDDGDGAIDFDVLSEKVSELASASSGTARQAGKEARKEQQRPDDDKKQYRSKDAGKTCKERFSYSSFDAGATVLKTNPGAKNPKTVLTENKDTYMLLDCNTKNKFVIVELSDDILVDTIVLANFEFFSSMVRHFRVSVSDRYPVKLDKWVDLGTFEARNSRDIQAFLVEHPQIYTKYLRIEFLTHYGNEYYCPISLLRVHGTRMLDTWKEPDSHAEEETDQFDTPEEKTTPDSSIPSKSLQPQPVSISNTDEGAPPTSLVLEMGLSPWTPIPSNLMRAQICIAPSATTPHPKSASSKGYWNQSGSATLSDDITFGSTASITLDPSKPASVTSVMTSEDATHSCCDGHDRSSPSSTVSEVHHPSANSISGTKQKHDSTPDDSSSDTPPSSPIPKQQPPPASSATSTRSDKTTTSSAATASPTVQESFFKSVSKRLQHLETNTSLSLQYIEDQSRFLQDALRRLERKQTARVDAFLDGLNKTALKELRILRTQYDELWQSTVLALEAQRESAAREAVALSARLELLAGEVVFQRRMAIMQSVLLLGCLVLVIFSNSGQNAHAAAMRGLGNLTHGADLSGPAFATLSRRSGYARAGGRGSTAEVGITAGFSPSPSPSSTPPALRPHAHGRLGGTYAEKTLPLTPTSECPGEYLPAMHIEGPDTALSDDQSPPRGTATERNGVDMHGGSGSNTAHGRYVDIYGEQDLASPARTMRPTEPNESPAGRAGSARKPLPPLPEERT